MVDIAAQIKKHIKEKKLIVGTEETIKALRLGKLSEVFLTSNCPEDVVADIEQYSKLANAKVTKMPYPNDEVGVLCKKPFAISVLGLLKQ